MKNKSYVPEIGQALFAPRMGTIACPTPVKSFLNTALDLIEVTYWNINQKEWDRITDPKIEGIKYRPFTYDCLNHKYDEQCTEECNEPLFQFQGAGIWWYKHPGRGLSVNVEWTEKQWWDWYINLVNHISAAGKNHEKL
jgi:hypothetical protein